ncbi:hypothetical protein CDD81_2755 [Ophiocordyceps australis]|uniref:2,5-diamino-6-ribosylamino-4(3H)-pyrimidinone 5'-phosphate reductase n=1 Tax=Ophiocordyceps australis TaxID=1399860 RepID=A0A2C5YCJ4_9HYPO|nr:hypothetical protein CDD81_2755 [Ophiocordyceps australis]
MAQERLVFPQASAALLEPHLPPTGQETKTFVTLTFATSLDSALSLAPGVRTRLSGAESKAMTHFVRSRHDAILIGVSTLLADDATLNCRLDAASQPRPIVLDPHCRWEPQPGNKVLDAQRRGLGLAPFVLCAPSVAVPGQSDMVLRQHGGKYIAVASTSVSGRERFEWRDVLAALEAERLYSVMVEGGGAIINSLLDAANQDLVDSVIVTIAPTWLGQGGVLVSPRRVHNGHGRPVAAATVCNVSWLPLGNDVVLCGRLAPRHSARTD